MFLNSKSVFEITNYTFVKICNKRKKTDEILHTTLGSYLKIVHRKNVSLVLNESQSFSLQYYTFSINTMSSRSLPLSVSYVWLKDEDNSTKLMDHNDLYVLDLSPSLKTLAMLEVKNKNLSTKVNWPIH